MIFVCLRLNMFLIYILLSSKIMKFNYISLYFMNLILLLLSNSIYIKCLNYASITDKLTLNHQRADPCVMCEGYGSQRVS